MTWRWPWVSRTAWDFAAQECADLQRRVQAQAEDARVERIRYDALLDKYHALKLVGAAVPVTPSPPREPREHDPIAAAIYARAGGDRRLIRAMGQFAKDQRTMGAGIEEILTQIEQGVLDDDGVPSSNGSGSMR